jgi:hypothetical protein
MAGDWIKWTKGLSSRREVVRMAGILNLSRAEVVVKLMEFWEWCDDNIPEDDIKESGSAFVEMSPRDGDNMAFIDDLVRSPGFADALATVNWIRFRHSRVELPNFGRHNGETAKTRARNSKNQKNKRSKPSASHTPESSESVTAQRSNLSPRDGDKTVTREREEKRLKSNKNPLPPDGGVSPAPQQRKARGDPAVTLAAQMAVVDAWNAIPGVVKVVDGGLTEKRRKALRSRLSDPKWASSWILALEAVRRIKWIKGDNERGWVAPFDWFLKPDTVVKLLEGQYDDGKSRPAQQGKFSFDDSIHQLAEWVNEENEPG